jgi:hypothetical protein
LVDFLLSKRIFERVGGGTTFLAERVGGPPVILTFGLDPLCLSPAFLTVLCSATFAVVPEQLLLYMDGENCPNKGGFRRKNESIEETKRFSAPLKRAYLG